MATHGGARKNAGKKKGTKTPRVIERDLAFQRLRERVLNSADSLINSQMGIAKGLTFLYVIKTIKGKRSKPRLITDQQTIEEYLAGDLENNGFEYYFMSTQRPDNKALDSLLDRTFDKSVQRTEIKDPDGALKTIIIERHVTTSKD